MIPNKMDKSSPTGMTETQLGDSVYSLQYEPSTESNEKSAVKKINSVHGLVVNDFDLCCGFVKSLKLEVLTFILVFSYIMRSVSSTTMILEKVCLNNFGMSEDFCSNMEVNKTIKNEVVKVANNYHLGHGLIQIIPATVISTFIGAWSDKYGRKVPLYVAIFGIILDGIGAILCAWYRHSSIEFYLASAIFAGLSGGFVSIVAVVYANASDMTSSKNRTFKYTIIEIASSTALPLGSLAGGWIYKYFGYVPIFTTSFIGYCLGLLWVVFVLEETRGLDNKDPWMVKIAKFFTFDGIIESYRTVSKKRPHNARLQIWLLVLTMCIAVLTLKSTGGISYLFTYHMYNWDNTKYSTVSAIFFVIGMLALMAAVPFVTKILKLGEASIGILGSVSLISQNITTSFAVKEGVYYMAQILGLFSSMSTLAGRTRISKLVPKSELGKMFSFISISESLIPIIGAAIFSQVFNVSIDIGFPGLAYLLCGLLMVISVGIFIWLARLPTTDSLEEEEVTPKDEDIEISTI